MLYKKLNGSRATGCVIQAFSGIFRDIKQYSAMFRHTEGH